MKRTVRMVIWLAALGGSLALAGGPVLGQETPRFGCGSGGCPAYVPGVQGPWGEPISMIAPYSADPPRAAVALAMMQHSLPLNQIQMNPMPYGIMQAGANMPAGPYPAGGITPPGVPFSPGVPGMTGPTGPGPMGSMGPMGPYVPPPGAVAAVGPLIGQSPPPFAAQRTEVRFVAPMGMKVSWFGPGPNGKPQVAGNQLEVIGRYNFLQGAIYRLKLSNIAQHPGLELYPTIEVVPSNTRTTAFLAHSAVPLAFTERDFDQVAAGNYVVKVIYLPDPQFQDIATTGPAELVSTPLEPGVDPIAEAYRRGSILLVVRMGNIDLEAPNTPGMDAPNPYAPVMPHPPIGTGHGPMVPYGSIGGNQPFVMGPGNIIPQGGLGGLPGMSPAGMLPGAPAGAGAVLPPTNPTPQPATPPMAAPPSGMDLQGGPGITSAQLPDALAVQQTQFGTGSMPASVEAAMTPAGAAAAAVPTSPAPAADAPPPKKSHWHLWPFRSKASDENSSDQSDQ
jgi:hypothetical protein